MQNMERTWRPALTYWEMGVAWWSSNLPDEDFPDFQPYLPENGVERDASQGERSRVWIEEREMINRRVRVPIHPRVDSVEWKQERTVVCGRCSWARG